MAFNTFTLNQLRKEFSLDISRQPDLFTAVSSVPISDFLRVALSKYTDVALRSGSEKARSELLIAPILVEVYERMLDRVNLFSGVEFKVDEAKGLSGFCDFIFTLAPLAIDIQSPVISVVEAKKEDIIAGIPQCLAELVAAQIYNAADGKPLESLYGVVTNGEGWKFLQLRGIQALIDDDFYYLDNVDKIVGIMLSMLQ